MAYWGWLYNLLRGAKLDDEVSHGLQWEIK